VKGNSILIFKTLRTYKTRIGALVTLGVLSVIIAFAVYRAIILLGKLRIFVNDVTALEKGDNKTSR
jgi:hypothetical protein